MESSPKDHPSATAFLNFLKATNSAINFYFLKTLFPYLLLYLTENFT